MKTILFNIDEGTMSYALLRTGFLKRMERESTIRLVAVVPSNKLDYYRESFRTIRNIEFTTVPSNSYQTVEIFWDNLFRQNIPTRTKSNHQWHSFYTNGSLIFRSVRLVGVRTLWLLGHLSLWRRFLRFLYGFTPHRAFDAVFDKYKPDLLFATTMYSMRDLGLMKAARAHGVAIVGMVKTWDSITTKFFMPIAPDYMIAHNEIIKSEAVKYLDFPASKIFVSGIPRFDFYFNADIIRRRADFLAQLGLQSDDKYILFAGDALHQYPDQCEFIDFLDHTITKDHFFDGYTILYRPHPHYGKCEGGRARWKRVKEQQPATRVTEGRAAWEFEESDIALINNTIYHAAAILMFASTIGIETALYDRPTIGVAFDMTPEPNYYLSNRRYYDSDHYQILDKSGGIPRAQSREEVIALLKEAIAEPHKYAAGRKLIVDKMLGFTDGHSAERIAQFLIDKLNQ
ncbi:hypothetical protein C4568_02425 [Candidatus Parcubacteria bacterium]|nr:MAG: hypothetical protein C4568_02425 [Candidatus Parcubacteria bacterium]